MPGMLVRAPTSARYLSGRNPSRSHEDAANQPHLGIHARSGWFDTTKGCRCSGLPDMGRSRVTWCGQRVESDVRGVVLGDDVAVAGESGADRGVGRVVGAGIVG
jgi:hypothetical protein